MNDSISRYLNWIPTLIAILTILGARVQAQWPSWRGPHHSGVSAETGLIDGWSSDGDGLLWKVPFIGRSTPVIDDGRVCAVGRVGDGTGRQERTACYDAFSGELLWEHRFNVFHTTIPFNRVGWSSPAADPETGNLYVHGVQGLLWCYDEDGQVLWSHSLTEEFGRISGYGGRIHTPVVDGDLVIVSFLNASWGEHAVPRHRYFAFDKRSGEVVWISTPGGRPLDTTYSTPIVAEMGGRRLLIGGNADGAIYGMEVGTGRKVWGFGLSKRGINVSVVVAGDRVYAAHSEENLDTTTMGRVVCIDGSGTGDVTASHEVWRLDGCQAGYTSPVVHDGRLYIVDNSANLHCLDAGSGKEHWVHNVGRVGKGSPVWADGKLFVPEVNGILQILEINDAPSVLDRDEITMPDGRAAEIFGSPAIGYGNVYLATENGLYCLGSTDDDDTSAVQAEPGPASPAMSQTAPTHIQIVPAEVLLSPEEKAHFEVRGFDDSGAPVSMAGTDVDIIWSIEGLPGMLEHGVFTAPAGAAVGHIRVMLGEAESLSRVRVVASGDQAEGFNSMSAAAGSNPAPAPWIGSGGGKFSVVDGEDGERILMKGLAKRGLQRSNVYLGPPSMSAYTVQADVMGTQGKRNRPDVGLIAQRYTLDLMGNHQRLQVRSWAASLRMAKTIDFPWEMGVWYSMKMRVDVGDGEALVKGKVWRRDTPEPEQWTIIAADPLAIEEGSPGLYGYSAAPLYYDNVMVSETSADETSADKTPVGE